MTSVQPFSYLTAQPAPLKPAFQRQDDDLVETVPASDDDFRAGNRNMQDAVVGHFSQSSAALPYHAMDYQRPQVKLGRSQTETSYDLRQHQHQQQQQQQPEIAYTGNQVKRPPDVAPKQQTKTSDPPPRMPDNWEEGLYGANRGGGGGGGGALYEQTNPLSTIDRLQERTDPAGDPDFANAAGNLYGHPNRQRKPDVQNTRKAEPQTATNYAPFSYTQPMGLSGVDVESRNGVGSKPYYSPSPEPPPSSAVRPRDSPPPPAVNPLENQTIFENFILVGPEKPPATRDPAPPATAANYAPFSYTQPIGLSGVDVESRGGVGSKHYYSPSPEPPPPSSAVRPRESPTPPAVSLLENQTIFENFILVGPEKPAATRDPAPPAREQPAKRLKLQELFDPPPPKQPAPIPQDPRKLPAPVPQDPRKLSIFGVTNTESSDYHSSVNHSTPNGNQTKTTTKTPVSTFDNPDYNLPSDGSRAYTPSGSVQGTSDDRSWSGGATHAFDDVGGKVGTATASGGFSKHRPRTTPQGRGQEANKTCVAVLITALVVGIFCLGAGFIAGWFGRGRSLGY